MHEMTRTRIGIVNNKTHTTCIRPLFVQLPVFHVKAEAPVLIPKYLRTMLEHALQTWLIVTLIQARPTQNP
jgi:hypothetical protein